MYFTALSSIAVAGLLVVGLAVAAFLHLRKKHRLIWKQLFSFREELEKVHDRQTYLAKQISLLGLSDLRLPAAMPSQYGEDLVLWNFFSRKRSGFYVDVGAYDGVSLSNTYFFEALGWGGILVEPNPITYEACKNARPSSQCVHAAVVGPSGDKEIKLSVVHGAGGLDTLSFTSGTPEHLERVRRAAGKIEEVTVPARSMEQILAGVDTPIDFISVDIEGGELEVLRGLDFKRHAPRCFVIEDNSGGADSRVADYLSKCGYVLRFRNRCNVFFVKAGDSGTFGF